MYNTDADKGRFSVDPVVLRRHCESVVFILLSVDPGRFIVKGCASQVGEDGWDHCRDCYSGETATRRVFTMRSLSCLC